MIGAAAWALLATVPSTGAAPVADEAAMRAAQAVLRRCPNGTALVRAHPDPRDWASQPSAAADHRALRQALGAALPDAPTKVTVYAAGGHLATTKTSVVATREPDGAWQVDAVGQTKIWVEGATPSGLTPRHVTLTRAAGRRLDVLLADPCLRAEPTSLDPGDNAPPPLGATVRRIEIASPAGVRRAVLMGDVSGLTAAVETIITEPLN